MSVKKSRTPSKPSGTRQQKAPTTAPGEINQMEEGQSTGTDGAGAKPEPVKNLSSRASRKVAAQKQTAAAKNESKAGAATTPQKSDSSAERRIIPSKRVWPD